MNTKLKHIFIFIFLLSVCSLTLQASIISICKENKVFKNQSNPASEEEEESHDSDEEADEAIFLNRDISFINSYLLSNSFWCTPDCIYFSFTKSIRIPPPKF